MSRGISGTESVVACGDDDDARGIDWHGDDSERGMSVSAISRTSRAMIPISRYVRFPRGQHSPKIRRAPILERIRSRSR